MDKEINEGGAALTNLRENRRIRKLQSDIQATQKEIDSCDLEGAAKAKRNFEEKYQPEKDRENEMQQKVTIHVPFSLLSYDFYQSAHIGGELTSLRAQLQKLEEDLREFKDINKKYTDQLVKVKVSFRPLPPQNNLIRLRCLTWLTMTSKNTERHWTSGTSLIFVGMLLTINA